MIMGSRIIKTKPKIIRRSRLHTEPQSKESAPFRTTHRMTQEEGDGFSSLANQSHSHCAMSHIPVHFLY